MSNVVIFETNRDPVYLKSVNTPDYAGNLNALINPDLNAVKGVPIKYWKRIDGNIVEMTAQEKSVIDQKKLEEAKSQVQLDIYWLGLLDILKVKGISITEEELLDAIKARIVL